MRKIIALFFALLSIVSCKENGDITPETPQVLEEKPTEYKIGDLYDVDGVKGLVFRVDEGGTSGLIVSMTEPETMLAWGLEHVLIGSSIRTSGEQNTAIIYSLTDWEAKYPAFAWCKSLGNGWYIPSVNELKELLLIGSSNTFAQAIIDNKATPFASDYKYLSSTEMDEF